MDYPSRGGFSAAPAFHYGWECCGKARGRLFQSIPKIINGGIRRRYAILITALSGFPTIIGALIGYCVGDIGPLGLAMSLSFASGAMLYVVFGEILPQSILMYRSKSPTFFVILGILAGLMIIHF